MQNNNSQLALGRIEATLNNISRLLYIVLASLLGIKILDFTNGNVAQVISAAEVSRAAPEPLSLGTMGVGLCFGSFIAWHTVKIIKNKLNK